MNNIQSSRILEKYERVFRLLHQKILSNKKFNFRRFCVDQKMNKSLKTILVEMNVIEEATESGFFNWCFNIEDINDPYAFRILAEKFKIAQQEKLIISDIRKEEAIKNGTYVKRKYNENRKKTSLPKPQIQKLTPLISTNKIQTSVSSIKSIRSSTIKNYSELLTQVHLLISRNKEIVFKELQKEYKVSSSFKSLITKMHLITPCKNKSGLYYIWTGPTDLSFQELGLQVALKNHERVKFSALSVEAKKKSGTYQKKIKQTHLKSFNSIEEKTKIKLEILSPTTSNLIFESKVEKTSEITLGFTRDKATQVILALIDFSDGKVINASQKEVFNSIKDELRTQVLQKL